MNHALEELLKARWWLLEEDIEVCHISTLLPGVVANHVLQDCDVKELLNSLKKDYYSKDTIRLTYKFLDAIAQRFTGHSIFDWDGADPIGFRQA